MKKFLFFHLIFEIFNFKFTIALENVYIFNDLIYVEIKYIRNVEKHFIKIKNRFVRALVISNYGFSSYVGFTPYWISSLNNINLIYNQEFFRMIGTIYYRLSDPVKGIFIFNKKLEEIFCIRLLKYSTGVNLKIIMRLR